MKVTLTNAKACVSGRVGPYCITCSNTRRFWIETPAGEQLYELSDLPDGDVHLVACGRCRSRHSIILAHID